VIPRLLYRKNVHIAAFNFPPYGMSTCDGGMHVIGLVLASAIVAIRLELETQTDFQLLTRTIFLSSCKANQDRVAYQAL
jgi:hypothetical protein